ncbi:MAG: ComEC/Rec2 family competence protein [Bryobacteraceae bacterium]|nr:ComEC/Rec2 family competence protein [Bryobacteraceae bacterium]
MPALFFAAGIFICPSSLWAVVALAVLSLIPGRARRFAVLSFFFAAGGWIAFRQAPGPDPQLDANSGEVLMVEGCVSGAVLSDSVRVRFPVELEPTARALVTVTTKPGEAVPHVSYGQRVEVLARIRKPRNFGNPGAFDYVGYLRRSQLFWTASARGVDNLKILPGECGSATRKATLGVREWLVSRIRKLTDDDLMPALLVGDNFALDRVQTAEFRRTGTYHAIVVSGLHVSVVAGIGLALMRFAGVPLGGLIAAGAGLAWLYAAVADWQAPVVRAAVGFTLFLLATWFFRRGRLLNLLAVTAILLLAVDPGSLYDASFQLTFLSVGAIAALAVPVADGTFGPCREGKGPRGQQFRCEMALVAETFGLPVKWLLRAWIPVFWVLEAITISACVQLALLAPSIAYFHQASATAVVANVAVVPALSAAVPFGLLAAITGWAPLAAVAGWLVWLGRAASSWFAALEPGIRIPDSPAWVGASLMVAVFLTGAGLLVRRRWTVVPALAAIGLAFAVLNWETRPPGGVLELTAVDVGQGDSLLVVLPGGRTLLVDGGGFPEFDKRIQSRMDIGEDVVSPYLWRLGLRRLDYVAVTHLHEDHAAGLPAVIRNFRPREVWTGLAPAGSGLLKRIEDAARVAGSRVVSLHEGDTRENIRVLWPKGGRVPGTSAHNDDSLVLLLTHGIHRFLLMGDAERGAEAAMAVPEEIDVLKAGHHGSRTSSTPEFVSRLRPLFALISAGDGNSYGHPHAAVVERLQQAGVRVLRTDRDGLVSVGTDGTRLRVRSYN